MLHRFFLPVLVGVYALAGFFPGPGAVIREFTVTLPGGAEERASMLLLAVLLFCAAAVIQWSQIVDLLERPSMLLVGLVTAWLGPALVVVLLGPLLPWLGGSELTSGMMVGFALVAAMPVANSAAGWTQNAGGNIALSLGLIVLSILLSPLATPNLLKLMGWALTASDFADRADRDAVLRVAVHPVGDSAVAGRGGDGVARRAAAHRAAQAAVSDRDARDDPGAELRQRVAGDRQGVGA